MGVAVRECVAIREMIADTVKMDFMMDKILKLNAGGRGCARKAQGVVVWEPSKDWTVSSETRGCPNVASDQRGFIQGEERLIRDERTFGGDFQQTSMESGEGVAVDRRPIRNWKMAAMMVVSGAVMVLTIIGQWMMMVVVMLMVLMGLSAISMIGMGVFMHHSGRHSCENAEGEKLLEEKSHVFR